MLSDWMFGDNHPDTPRYSYPALIRDMLSIDELMINPVMSLSVLLQLRCDVFREQHLTNPLELNQHAPFPIRQ